MAHLPFTKDKYKLLEERYFETVGGLVAPQQFFKANKKDFTREEVDLFFKKHHILNQYYGLSKVGRRDDYQATTADYPGEKVHLDFVEFQDDALCKYGLVAVDSYSSFLFVFPMTRKTTAALQRATDRLLEELKP